MIVRVVDYDSPFRFEGVPVLGDFRKWALTHSSQVALRAKGLVMETHPLHRAVDVTLCSSCI